MDSQIHRDKHVEDVMRIIDSINLFDLDNKFIGKYERRVDRYLSPLVHNLIYEISKQCPRFIENARVVVTRNRLGEEVFFVCDGIWIQPFTTKPTLQKANKVISPTTLGNAKVRFEKPIPLYLFTHYGLSSKRYFNVDFGSNIWMGFLLDQLQWDFILVNIIKQYFKKEKNSIALNPLNSYDFAKIAIDIIDKLFETELPKEWKSKYHGGIKVVTGRTKNNRIIYWLEIGTFYVGFAFANDSNFVARPLSKIDYTKHFETDLNDFILLLSGKYGAETTK